MTKFPYALLLVMVLAWVLLGPALAVEPAQQVSNGEPGVIDARIGEDRLVISDMVYRVGFDTVIAGPYGQALTLQEIPVGASVRINADYTNVQQGYLLRRIEKVK